jgi:hypothetical protein
MNATRAYSLGVRADQCKVVSESNRYGGAWRVDHPDQEAVFISSASNPVAPIHFIINLRKLEAA